ncbi:MAG: HD domain-containing protein [Eubacteriales bacterium]
MTPERASHTEGVISAALSIASDCFPGVLDPSAVRAAASLHDATKELDQISLCAEYGITPDRDMLACPSVLHAVTGAEYARRQGCTEEICSAIRSHTTGAPDMTPLAQVLFVADCIEPGRRHPSCMLLREEYISMRGTPGCIDTITLRILDSTLRHLLDRGVPIHPDTLITRNFYLLKGTSNNDR